MSVNFDLTEKTAVITGGSGVICSVIAKELAKKGVRVAVVGLHAERAKVVAESILREGGIAISCGANVLDKKSLEEAKNYILEKFGRVDILINGAGGNNSQATTSEKLSFFDIDAESLREVFDLNVTGTIMTTQVFGQLLVEAGSGCVINISSMAANHPLTKTLAYSAAKAAINNFTQWMAVHFNQNYSTRIRVNAIAPGFLLTTQIGFLCRTNKETLRKEGAVCWKKPPWAAMANRKSWQEQSFGYAPMRHPL